MDLSKLAVAETATLQIMHPVTEEAIDGMAIEFHGPTSNVVRKLNHARQQAALNRLSKGKKATLKAEELDEESVEDQFKRAIGWTGFELNGKKLEFTLENWRTVMADYPWLRAQVTAFVNDDGSFLA